MALALTPGQATFASTLGSLTGLSPRVISAWIFAEQNGSAAKGYESRGYNNWLNIANTDSGPASGAHSDVWRSPVTAAHATAEWLSGRGKIAHEYGQPAPGIKAILSAAHGSPGSQIAAIARSGWASSGYEHGQELVSLFNQTSGQHLPAPSAAPAQGQTVPGQLSVSDGSSASLAPLLQQLLAKVQQPQPPAASIGVAPRPSFAAGPTLPEGSRHVQGLAPTQAPADESAAKLVQAALGAAQAGEPHITSTGPQQLPPSADESGHYVNPLPGFAKGRTDQGVDYSARPGSPILAIGNGKVLGISPNWFEGQPYVAYQLHDGPRAGQVIYVAEQIVPHVRPGQQVRAGQRIGVYAPTGTGIETGFGSHTLGRVLTPYNGAADGTETSGGKQARGFLEHLGAR